MLSSLNNFFFKLFMIATPITAVAGISSAGELSSQLTTYIVLLVTPFLLLSLPSTALRLPKELVLFFLFFSLAVGLSLFFSWSTITATNFYGRSGVEKSVTSYLVIVFGFFVTLFVFTNLLYGKEAGHKFASLIYKPLLVATLLNLAVASFELSSSLIPALKGMYSWFSYNIFHTQHGFLETPGRIRALGTEPSHFGVFVGLVIPWLMAFRSEKPKFTALLILLLLVFTYLSFARTAYLVILITLPAFFAIRFAIRRNNASLANLILFLSVAGVFLVSFAIYFFQNDLSYFAAGTSVSNITRLSTVVASLNIFAQHALAGVGFGQGSFHTLGYLPDWAFSSYEIMMYLDERSGSTAPIFSLFARIAAEMGVVGLFAWYGMWLLLLRKATRFVCYHKEASEEDKKALIALLTSFISMLAIGFSVGSFRLVILWIGLGVAGYLIYKYRPAKAYSRPA